MISNSIQAAIVVCGTLVVASEPVFAQTTMRVSVDSFGVEANDFSFDAVISADGRIVAFRSAATNLVTDDTNGVWDLFAHDLETGITQRISVDSSGAEADDLSEAPAISADGRFVVFASRASNLVQSDMNGTTDVFVRDRLNGVTERVSVDSSGSEANSESRCPAISADGRIVSFYSTASNLIAGDTNGAADVFIHDLVTGITERVSVDSAGVEANQGSTESALSRDGRFIAFRSRASNLVGWDSNDEADIFVHDCVTGSTELVSVNSQGYHGNWDSLTPAISADGNVVAFWSNATNLVPDDLNGFPDIFVHDRTTGITERVNVDSNGAEARGNTQTGVAISADGRSVAFWSSADNLVLGDTNQWWDAFLHDRVSAVTECLNVTPSGVPGNGASGIISGAISPDGQFVAITSEADDIIDGDVNGVADVFVRRRPPLGAAWFNYGVGLPGAAGVPAFTSRTNPALGTTVSLDLANSGADYTVGALFIGVEKTVIHSMWGGDLLVVPLITQLVGLSPWGASIFGDIPNDETLAGLALELQAIEVDPGAAKGFSFTQGLELVLGH
jgi:hypothetical protein